MGQVHIGYQNYKNKADKLVIEKIIEKPIYIEKVIEVPIYLNKPEQETMIHYIDVYKDKIIEIEKVITVYEQIPPIETIKTVEVIKEVPIYTEKYIDVPRDVIKEVIKYKIPNWVYPIFGLEGLTIILLLFFK